MTVRRIAIDLGRQIAEINGTTIEEIDTNRNGSFLCYGGCKLLVQRRGQHCETLTCSLVGYTADDSDINALIKKAKQAEKAALAG